MEEAVDLSYGSLRINKQEDIFIIMFRDVQLKPLAAEYNGKNET